MCLFIKKNVSLLEADSKTGRIVIPSLIPELPGSQIKVSPEKVWERACCKTLSLALLCGFVQSLEGSISGGLFRVY